MNDTCLQCAKGPVLWWKNDYINYYDFKCTACGYVWHDTNPGKGKPRRNNDSASQKKSSKSKPAKKSSGKKSTKKSAKRKRTSS